VDGRLCEPKPCKSLGSGDRRPGITVRTPHGIPPQLTTLGAEAGLPALPETTLSLFESGQTTSAADRFAEILIDTLEGTIGAAM
jgi:hypothetical protein